MKKCKLIFYVIIASVFLYGCQQDNYIVDGDDDDVTNPEITDVNGFYLLNEGNMGSNSATIDYMDFTTGFYNRNIYATANPTIVKELGDVGNDIKIYGNKLYAVINNSNLIEVMDVKTAKHLATIPLENGRYINFANGKGYATSYAGLPSEFPNSPYGKVVEIDTINLSITREVTVGRQPDGLEIVENELFVANSGGYTTTNNYENTVSVINLESFKEIERIEVGINLNQIKKDNKGDLYITSRGNYGNISPNLFVIDSKTHQVKKIFNIPVSSFTINDDQLYYYSYSYLTQSSIYGVINTTTKEITSDNFIKDSNIKDIKIPYSININPQTKDIFITDAVNYISKGFVYCFNKDGIFKWKTEAGNIPAHIAFVYKKK